MKNYKVLLMDTEEQFVVSLMNYVNRNTQIPILLLAFTKMDEAMDYLSSHKPDLILAGDEFLNELSDEMRKIPILRIVDEWKEPEEKKMSNLRDGEMEELYVFKYSPASAYVHRMLQQLSEKRCQFSLGKAMNSIAVYSPVGRCGVTQLAKEFCKAFCVQDGGKSVLYIGWEEFATVWDEERRMEQCLYYVKQRSENLSMKLKTLALETQGYDYLPSGGLYSELRELEREDIQWLLERVKQEGYYDFLVVDIGAGSLLQLDFLREFSVIYIPYLQDLHVEQKMSQFAKVMELLPEGEVILDKCFPVCISDGGVSMEQCQRLEDARKHGDLHKLQQVVSTFDRRHL